MYRRKTLTGSPESYACNKTDKNLCIIGGESGHCLLILAHDKQGHNGFRRTYASLRNRYQWKGMKKSIHQHCSRCQVCAKHNIKTQQLKNEHFSSPPQPMEFIAMDLIGEFHPASSKGNRYALTAVCMLTGFTFCIPLKSKRAEDVIKAYIQLFPHRIIRSRTILPHVRMRSSSKTHPTRIRKPQVPRNRRWHDKSRTYDQIVPRNSTQPQ